MHPPPKKNSIFSKTFVHLYRKGLFNKSVLSIEIVFKAALKVTSCPSQVVCIHVGCVVHIDSPQQVLGILQHMVSLMIPQTQLSRWFNSGEIGGHILGVDNGKYSRKATLALYCNRCSNFLNLQLDHQI